MTRDTKLRGLRAKAKRLYAEYMAILTVTNQLDRSKREVLQREFEDLDSKPRQRLRNLVIPKLEERIRDLRVFYGITMSARQLRDLVERWSRTAQPGKFTFISKAYLGQLCDHFERAFPKWPEMPPHAEIGIDVYGTRESVSTITVKIQEAQLFEDMAILWNATLDAKELTVGRKRKPSHVKECDAFGRATARAAFHMLECYLKNLGFDICYFAGMDFTQIQKGMLTETEAKNGKRRYLSLRDKVLKYPRIALSSKHPPMTETNCPEFASILKLEKEVRHPLVHPVTVWAGSYDLSTYQGLYSSLDMESIGKLCDDAIGLIRRIDGVLEGMLGRAEGWLFDRGPDERFPPETFV